MANLKAPSGYEDFDPECYLSTYYNTVGGAKEDRELLPFFLDSFHDIFSSGTVCGDKLLDVGTGPTVYSVISASAHVNEIHLSDYAGQNRNVLQKWLDGAPNVPALFEYIIKRENEDVSLEYRVQAVREKVKKILPLDLFQEDLIEDKTCKYDVITSSFCLEVTSTSIAEYNNMVAKIANHTNLGGHVVMVGELNENFYPVGDYKFTCLSLERKDVKEAFENAGFEIKLWTEFPNKNFQVIEEKGLF